MKNTFKIESLAITIDRTPVELKGIEFTNEANAQELATSGGFINQLVETIGNIAERFDNKPENEIKEIEVKPKKVSDPKLELPTSEWSELIDPKDFCEVKEPELPTSEWHGGKPLKKKFNITKAWRAIPMPTKMKKVDPDKYRWLGEQYPIADSVTVDGDTYGVVYIHIEAMHKKSFIIVRPENVKFEDDVKPEEFQDFLEAINIPNEIKDYIKKVIEL